MSEIEKLRAVNVSLVAALQEVIDVVESEEMFKFWLRASDKGVTYSGPRFETANIRLVLARAEAA